MKKNQLLFLSLMAWSSVLFLSCENDKGSQPRWPSQPAPSEKAAAQTLQEWAKKYNTLDDWEKRAEEIRKGILKGARLDPFPPKTNLNPIFRESRSYDGYEVINVAFESLPGFYVIGNLYKPLDRKGKAPGILSPHGHFKGGRFHADIQKRCATLARMGAVVFTYDLTGWNESRQYPHTRENILAVELWNAIRGIDFLVSIPEVDPNQIGVTGGSGGGIRTILLAAVDDRVKVSIPAVQISAHDLGFCLCSSGMPIHASASHETNNVEITAVHAPKPLLLISAELDPSSKNTPEVEFPHIQKIYALYGKTENAQNLHLENEGHDFGFEKRKGAYRFFAKYFDLELSQIQNLSGEINETGSVVEEPRKMIVFGQKNRVPEDIIRDPQQIDRLLFRNK